MSLEHDNSPEGRLVRGARRPARLLRTICQMILGAGLAVTLILKVYMIVLTDHVCAADVESLGNVIRCTPTLAILAYVIAISAGIDLAYRLFEHDMDRVLAPLTLGLGAAVLSLLNGMQEGEPHWWHSLVIVSLVASLAGIQWLRWQGSSRGKE